MQIVLPGALPDPREARELAAHLPGAAPTLARWLQQGRAAIVAADPARTGCTPYEQWLVSAHGFVPDPGQNLGAGLGPLWGSQAVTGNTGQPDGTHTQQESTMPAQNAGDTAQQGRPAPLSPGVSGALVAPFTPSQAVWLAELVHVAPSRDGAALLPARELSITPGQSVALFQSAQSLMQESGFTPHLLGSQRWRVDIQDGSAPACASPALVATTSVNDWWPQDAATRPWRRLVNELQMLWFDHPVNQERASQGLAPINSLWLFGGARPEQFPSTQQKLHFQTCDNLLEPSLKHDWASWIAALEELERTIFQPLAQRKITPGLILTGREKVIELRPSRIGPWKHWLPGGRESWRNWWSPQN